MSQLNYTIRRRVPPNPKLLAALVAQTGPFTPADLAAAAGVSLGEARRFTYNRCHAGTIHRDESTGKYFRHRINNPSTP